jgi:hypothetical protein
VPSQAGTGPVLFTAALYALPTVIGRAGNSFVDLSPVALFYALSMA